MKTFKTTIKTILAGAILYFLMGVIPINAMTLEVNGTIEFVEGTIMCGGVKSDGCITMNYGEPKGKIKIRTDISDAKFKKVIIRELYHLGTAYKGSAFPYDFPDTEHLNFKGFEKVIKQEKAASWFYTLVAYPPYKYKYPHILNWFQNQPKNQPVKSVQPTWSAPNGYEHIKSPTQLKDFKNIIKKPNSRELWGERK